MNNPTDDAPDALATFGARPERWPPERRAELEQSLHENAAVQQAWDEAARLDAVLDAYGVDDGTERLARLSDDILDEVESRGGSCQWAFAPIGWAQGLGIASVVGVLSVALLVLGGTFAIHTAVGLKDLIVSTTPWIGSY